MYKFSYLGDANVTYSGQSKRHLVTRMGEHPSLGRINPQFEMRNHIYDCKDCHSLKLNCEKFEILNGLEIPEGLYLLRG